MNGYVGDIEMLTKVTPILGVSSTRQSIYNRLLKSFDFDGKTME